MRQGHFRKHRNHLIELLEIRRLLSASPLVSLTTDATGVSSHLKALVGVGPSSQPTSGAQLIYDGAGNVDVKITAVNINALLPQLEAIGFSPVGLEPAQHFMEGFLPPAALDGIQSLSADGLMGVFPIYKPMLAVGAVTSEGDQILEADRARAATGVTGAGVTVGVLSDSYNNLGTASSDVASGDLPSNVDVLQDLSSGGTDEGRAMLQIVHDLAPGSNLAFATADFGQSGFANNIINLAAPVSGGGGGAKVEVDDVYYYDEPLFQDGVISDAINQVATNDGVSYFTAAGNDDTQSYDSSNVSFNSAVISGISGSPQQYYNFNFGGSPANQQSLTLTAGQSLTLGLEWDQPYYTVSGVTSNINLFLLNSSGGVVASGTTNTIAAQEPYQQLDYTNSTSSSATYSLVISLAGGTVPGQIKYLNFGDGSDVQFNNYFTNSSTITPHSAAVGAMSVAADASYDQRTLESYSSEGPFTARFDSSGNRLSSPQVRAKPDITSIDGVSTTFFGDASFEPQGYPTFFGTSAAAPHAAAIAALLQAEHPAWTPSQIDSDLKATADPNLSTTNPNFIGAGLIDAYRAMLGSATPVLLTANEGFESGVLGQSWTTDNAGAGRTQVQSGNSPASGSYQLVEDSYDDAWTIPELSQAILNLNVPSYASNVMLSFSQKKFSGTYGGFQTDYAMPATFTGSGDYDGVAFSVDGVNWYRLVSLVGTGTSYAPYSFNLSAIAAADGVVLTSSTQIKFQHYDHYSFSAPDGGFGFDNILTTAGISLSGTAFYARLDADAAHVDIWNANNTTGAVYASLLAMQLTSVTINTTGSPQSFTVDFSNGAPLPTGAAYNASGSPASNRLIVVGTAAGSDSLVSASGLFSINGISISNSDVGSTNFQPGAGTDSLNVSSGSLQLIRSSATGLQTDHFSTISIGNSARLLVAPPSAHPNRTLVQTTALSIAGLTGAWTGTLDLSGNDMTVTAGNLATITNQIATGFAGGNWHGNGIISSMAAADTTHLTALGAIPNTANGSAPLYGTGGSIASSFDGAASLPTAAVLIKYTYFGDANLDGRVDGSDYSLIDNGYLNHLTGWFNGDLNYDSSLNGSDYTLVDNTFNTQGASLATQIAPRAIVESQSAPTVASLDDGQDTNGSLTQRRRRKPIIIELE